VFRLASEKYLTRDLARFVKEAYRVGEQRHLEA
jgi:hypothetical protein